MPVTRDRNADPVNSIADDGLDGIPVTFERPTWAEKLGWASMFASVVRFLGEVALAYWRERVTIPSWVDIGMLTILALSIVLLVAGAVAAFWRRKGYAEFHIGDSRLTITWPRGRRLDVPRERIKSGLLLPSAQGTRAELTLSEGDVINIEQPNYQSGEQLLERLELDPIHRQADLVFGAESFTSLWLAVAAVMLNPYNYGGDLSPILSLCWAILYIFSLLTLAFILGLKRLRLHIGTDGLHLFKRLSTRFIPYDDIQELKTDCEINRPADPNRFYVVLHSRETVQVGPVMSNSYLVGLLQRIQVARGDNATNTGTLALLDRGDQSLTEWRTTLKRLLSADGDYRGLQLTDEKALDTITNAAASIERRLAAAVALCEAGLMDAEASSRVRIAAAAAANPKLRIALDAAADGELELAAVQELLQSAKKARPNELC